MSFSMYEVLKSRPLQSVLLAHLLFVIGKHPPVSSRDTGAKKPSLLDRSTARPDLSDNTQRYA